MLGVLGPLRALVTAAWATWAAALPGAPVERAWGAAEAVLGVVDERGPLPGLDAAETAQLLLAWSLRESSWKVDAIGDVGASCGVMQVRAPWKWTGATCAALTRDLRVGYAAGHVVMRHAIVRCGGLRAGLGAYATKGRCGGARTLVAARLALAGLGAQ